MSTNNRFNKYSPERKTELVRAVNKLRNEGLSIRLACEQAGMQVPLYNWWAREINELPKTGKTSPRKGRTRSEIRMDGPFEVAVQPPVSANARQRVRVMVFEGSPEEVAEAMARLKDINE